MTKCQVIKLQFKVKRRAKLTLTGLPVRFQFEALEAGTGVIGHTAMSTIAYKKNKMFEHNA